MRKIALFLIIAALIFVEVGLSSCHRKTEAAVGVNQKPAVAVAPEHISVSPQPAPVASPTISLLLDKPFESPARIKEQEIEPLLVASPTAQPTTTPLPHMLEKLSRIGISVDENRKSWVHYDFSDKSTIVKGAESQPPPVP